MTDIDAVAIRPVAGPLTGRVTLPGSKSITNRALLVAALSDGTSHLRGVLKSDDTRHMATALRVMGVTVDEPGDTDFVVRGDGRLRAPADPLFLGNAGTATRFLTAAAALADGPVVLDGDPHMRRRPIRPLVDALGQLGVTADAPTGCPPVTVDGSGLRSGRVEIDATLSSQYVSAMLMLGACVPGGIDVALSHQDLDARGYVDLTIAVMRAFGADVRETGPLAWTIAESGYRATDFDIEPDASAATYFWAAEALTGGAIDIGLSADRFTQPDAAAYAMMRHFPSLPERIDGSQMQDAVPTIAVLAAFNDRPVRFTGIANLRVKECDRISALSTELNRLAPGMAREEGDDLIVMGKDGWAAHAGETVVHTYGDHRMAMALALAGLKMPGVRIADPRCVDKTFPQYWDRLAELGVGIDPLPR